VLGGAAEGLRRIGGAEARSSSSFMTGANAERLARRLSNMRGAAMKLGQMLSLEADDLLPPEVAEALSVLRAEGDAMPDAQLRRVLGRAWGKNWQERFREFDFEPIAAASIGQVHAAVTRDGREIACKVQYPGVADSIDSDVGNLATAFKISRILPGDLDFDPIIAEAKWQLSREADYRMEARHLARYGELLAGDSEFVVPRVHDDFSTKRVLAMDRLHGVPLEDLRGPEHDDGERDRAGALLLRLLLRELFEFRFMQTDPNFANYQLLPDGRIGLLDLGAGNEITKKLSRGYEALFRAALDRDEAALKAAAERIGFLSPDVPAPQAAALVGLFGLAMEPFCCDGVYDFGASDLPARVRERGMELMFESHHLWRPPPPATLFLQRKLGGTFLLCVRLGARVDARALVEEALPSAGSA